MNPNGLGLGAAAGAFILFWYTYHAAVKLSIKTRLILAFVLVDLAIPGLSFAVYYAHILPEMAWYYEFRSWPSTELLLLPIGVSGALFASLMPRRYLLLPLLSTAVCVCLPVWKSIIVPLPQNELKDQWKGDVCLQSTSSTCGAASAATILKLHGITITERQIAQEAYSSASGTEAWYLARAIRNHGGSAKFHCTSGFSPEMPLPAIAGVRLGPVGHFIPILAREGDKFQIGDPLNGPETLSLAELLKRYDFTGFYLQIQK
jgi:hypothetical protein